MIESKELQSLKSKRDALEKQIRNLEQIERAKACPFKLNQIIEWKHGKGRRRGKVVAFYEFCGNPLPVVEIILKDGSNGGRKTVREWEEPKLVEGASHG